MATPRRDDIPIGRDNAISRATLAQLWGCSDRNARDYIARFRAAHEEDSYAILSTSHQPAGYWRSNSIAEIQQFIKETHARGRNTFIVLRDARAVLKRMSGQIKMEMQK